MNLLEYQAKKLLHDAGVPLPASWLIKHSEQELQGITFPVVAKSQVPVGGRGKAGGVVIVENDTTLASTIEKLLRLPIKDHLPSSILLEEAISIAQEYYLALKLDRDSKTVQWLVSKEGGIDIEENADSLVVIDFADANAYGHIADTLDLPLDQLNLLLESLSRCFSHNDALLLEINPLVLTDENQLLCADAKVTIDDNARFRQPDLPWPEASSSNLRPLGGTIGCIANGAGMAMSTMDTIVSAGGRPANFLDIGGGAGEKEFVIALKNIMELPGVTSIIVNIFAGISRCDEIARGIIAAREQLPDLPPLFIRLEGTNRDIAVELLRDADIAIEPDLKTCVHKAMEVNS